jgi:hypothetical protein
MGLTIDRERFDPQDYRRFERRLDDCLTALERLLERPGFGTGPATVGAELELFLVDGQGRALPRNQEVRAETADPRVVLEIDRFNLELNLTPAPLAGDPVRTWPLPSGQVERSWRDGSRNTDSTSSMTRVARSAKRPGRNGASRPSWVPPATSLATSRPSTGATVTPLWLTARYSGSSQGRGPTIGRRSAGMAR